VSVAPPIDVDADLVDALRRGDPDAAERLVERHGDRVYTLAMRLTGEPEDADAAALEALCTAARGVESFGGEPVFSAWVDRIAARAAYEKLRLRQGDRAILVLHDAQAMSKSDIASVLGISVAEVRSRLHHARLGLCRRLS
jgi:DNA-directed RNA polymerase specialized sigma24 family protein